MRFVMFYHSLVSDWNHGNAHFLRGVVSDLIARGHTVTVYEPRDGWSLSNLKRDQGDALLHEFRQVYPGLTSRFYVLDEWDLDQTLSQADVVLVHEWNDHELVRRVGEARARSQQFRLLFHDTHHRAVTDRPSMAAYDLKHYDGVLAFGGVLRDLYLAEGWARRAW
ncbi:MAG: glycosyltransferase, partial [Planctomycetaceae bacterium]